MLATDKASQGFCHRHQHRVAEALQRRKRGNKRANQRANAKRRADEQQAELDAFYSGKHWRRARTAHRAREPLCRRCSKRGVVKAGDVVDHIIERRDGGNNYDPANLQTLCHKCHSDKTREERERRHHESIN